MNSLVIYFSRADENYGVGNITKGNTEVIAEMIANKVGAKLFKVEPKVPYSKGYKACCDEALKEQHENSRPELKEYLDDISEFDIVFIGCPIYWGTMPQSMFTALEKLDFNGKKIYVFTTHEGSGLGRVPSDVKKVCQGAEVVDSIAIKGSSVYSSEDKINEFLKNIKE